MRSRSSRRTEPTNRSAIALARGARTGVLMMRMSVAVKTASNAVLNLASRSRMRTRNRRPASYMSRLRGLLGQAGAGGMRGDTQDVHPAGGVLDDEERIQPAQGDRVEVEEVAGEDRVGLGPQELGPGWSGPSGRGVDAGVVQDDPDGGGSDPVAEADEFAVEASVSPSGVTTRRAGCEE
jgi:hypothetical protein